MPGLLRLLIAWLLLLVAACAPPAGEDAAVLRVALLPEESRISALDRYAPLFDHLEARTGRKIQVIFPSNYAELLAIFHQGGADLARFGGYTFVKAHHADGARPLVMGERDARSTSLLVVRKDDPAQDAQDLKGKRLAFGSPLSTAGHMMPRFYLEELGIHPETFFGAVHFAGTHDGSAAMVQSGEADAAMGSSAILNPLFKAGKLEELRILWETPPYVNYVWAVPRSLPESTFSHLRLAFLSLSLDKDPDYRALAPLESAGFLPATLADFEPIFAIEAAWEKRE